MRHCKAGLTMLSTAAVLLCAGSALGQNALGDGTALDRNLQVGSGGKNTRVRDLGAQIRFNNAIVTGQAIGGASFRGSVGYSATNEFRASTSSDDLYTFRRDSAYSAAPALGIRGSDALRYQFALATGSAIPGSFANGPGTLARSPVSTGTQIQTRVPAPEHTLSAFRSTSQYTAQRSLRPSVIGVQEDDSGGQYTITASPLLSVSLYKTAQRKIEEAPDDPFAIVPGSEAKKVNPQLERLKSMPVRNPLTGIEARAMGVPDAFDLARRDEIGAAQERARLNAERAETRTDASGTLVHQRAVSEFRSAFEARQAASASPGAKRPITLSWDEELIRIRAALRGQDQVKAIKDFRKSRGGDQDESGQGRAATQPGQPRTAADVAGSMLMNPGAIKPASAPDLEEEIASMRRAGERLGLSAETVDALRAAGVRLDRLDPGPAGDPTIAGSTDVYRQHMISGQEALKAGRYFDAEGRFTRALATAPGDPMAMLGRIHAQLSGGLYLSAGTNLREFLSSYPELAGTTYGPSLVPDAERAAMIKTRLRDELARNPGEGALGRDAGLLLAYVGRLSDDPEAVRQGLREFNKRVADTDAEGDPDFALGELLERLWTQAPASQKPASE